MARLYADENFPLPAVEALRRLGHDVLTAAEAGQAGQGIADDAVLTFAHALGRAVLTHNGVPIAMEQKTTNFAVPAEW